jgi:hypothetical protein
MHARAQHDTAVRAAVPEELLPDADHLPSVEIERLPGEQRCGGRSNGPPSEVLKAPSQIKSSQVIATCSLHMRTCMCGGGLDLTSAKSDQVKSSQVSHLLGEYERGRRVIVRLVQRDRRPPLLRCPCSAQRLDTDTHRPDRHSECARAPPSRSKQVSKSSATC